MRPYKTAADLIAAAKAKPGKINYGSGGNGSPQHIAMALFASQAGITMTHVPYKGATQAAIDVAGGRGAAAFQGIATVDLAGARRQAAPARRDDAAAACRSSPTCRRWRSPGCRASSSTRGSR